MQAIQTMNAKKMYPISVDYVFKMDYDPEDPNITLIRDYCKIMKIKFCIRKYDSLTFVEDKTLIEKLPAIHVYIKKVHTAITYPNDNSLESLIVIRDIYDAFDIEYMAYLSKKQIWNERLHSLKRIFLRNWSKTDLNHQIQS